MKVGVTIPAYDLGSGRARSFSEMADEAVAAEDLGYDSVWVMDHVFLDRGGKRTTGGPEPLAFLSHVAARTGRIELGTLVLCAPFRLPVQLAREAKTLQAASGGRFILGIGAGWHEPEFEPFGIPFDHLVSRFEDYVEVLTRLLGHGHPEDFEGRYQVLRRGEVFGEPAPLPWIAAGGHRMLRLTGRLAGGWNGAWYGRDPSLFRERLAELDAALLAANRTRSDLVVSAGLVVLPGADEPRAIGGSLEEVVEAIGRYREAGCDHAILNFSPTPFAGGDTGLPGLLAPLLGRLRGGDGS
jgi:alkanesulfonate monooxygenase SsuD/methylene tetrahydromethanopterin reductase-like flavin-dependent oxidoreductase (luciferase family)